MYASTNHSFRNNIICLQYTGHKFKLVYHSGTGMRFFKEMKTFIYWDLLLCKFWIAMLLYLDDIFCQLNILNNGMKAENIIMYNDKIKLFHRKLHYLEK